MGIAPTRACCISCYVFGGAKVRSFELELEQVVLSTNLGLFVDGCSKELLHSRRNSSSSSSVKFSWVELVTELKVGGLAGMGVAVGSVSVQGRMQSLQ